MKTREEWTGRSFKRGDHVHFKGTEILKPYDTYVWTVFAHRSICFYIIEHPDGHYASRWMASGGFDDGFESVHSSELNPDLKYIQINCSDDFFGETDELVLIEEPFTDDIEETVSDE